MFVFARSYENAECVQFAEFALLETASGALGTVPSSVGCSNRSDSEAPGGDFSLKVLFGLFCWTNTLKNRHWRKWSKNKSDFGFLFLQVCSRKVCSAEFQCQNAGTGFATERCCCSPPGRRCSKCHASQVICIQSFLAAFASDLCKSGLKHVQKTRGFTSMREDKRRWDTSRIWRAALCRLVPLYRWDLNQAWAASVNANILWILWTEDGRVRPSLVSSTRKSKCRLKFWIWKL